MNVGIMGRMDYASSRAGLGPLLKGLFAQWISGFGQNSGTFWAAALGSCCSMNCYSPFIFGVLKCNPNVIRMCPNWRCSKPEVPEAVYLRCTSSGHKQALEFNAGNI